MAYNIFSTLHEFFFFLSTIEGILVRASIELIIFVLVTYMIISEYLREKNTEYRFLSMAFGSLAVQRLITTLVYGSVVFGPLKLYKLNPFLPVILNFFEALAFILLANGFIYPFRKNFSRIIYSIEAQTIALVITTLVIQAAWLIKAIPNPYSDFSTYFGFFVFNAIKLIFLAYPLFVILRLKHEFRHRYSLVLAFLSYAMVPLLELISFIIYRDLSPRIVVFLNPFPFISVMLFTKVIYLKLVDKATLKDKLRASEERYKAEKELSEMKDSFVSVVSHELRTPLTSMKLYSKLLTKDKFGKMNRKQKRAIRIISQETDRLSELINDILNLSKLESKKEPLKISKFDFYRFSKNHHIYKLAEEKGIKVKVAVPKNFILKVDKDKITQVFINLMSNAIKFTDKGGSIGVIARNTKDNWEIIIKDTGRGIPKDQISKLFDKFFQVESYMTGYKGGTGLGLAIAKKIVDMHNGRIEVESKLGKGSEFSVLIPKKAKVL